MNYNELLEKIIEKQRKNVKKLGAEFPYNDVDGEFLTIKDRPQLSQHNMQFCFLE